MGIDGRSSFADMDERTIRADLRCLYTAAVLVTEARRSTFFFGRACTCPVTDFWFRSGFSFPFPGLWSSSFLAHCVEPWRPHQTRPPRLAQDGPQNSKRACLSALALQTLPTFHEKTSREGKTNRILGEGFPFRGGLKGYACRVYPSKALNCPLKGGEGVSSRSSNWAHFELHRQAHRAKKSIKQSLDPKIENTISLDTPSFQIPHATRQKNLLKHIHIAYVQERGVWM